MDLKVASTIGFERNHNAMLAIDDEQEFIDASISKLGAQPPNFKAIVALNHGPLLTDGVELARLFPQELEQRQRAGAIVVDVRTDLQFADGHVPGSISIPLHRGGFGTKLAWVAGAAEQIIFVGSDEDAGRRAGNLAAAVGLAEPVRRGGLLAGGWTGWSAEGRPIAKLTRVAVPDIGPYLDASTQVLDVRERAEYDAGHIPDSLNVPWHDIDGIPAEVDPDRRLLVICASGQRAATAASLLQHFGATEILHVVGGGVPRWGALGGSLTGDTRASVA
jgi:rhodanese-related sulfurtransferase